MAAGVGKTISAALLQGGQLEQSIGGVETLFKQSADKVKQYAAEAYKTAGLSANEYMQNVTSFSASLLQSLGGDTGKAADVANMAMIDMSDNMNKMGSDMESIQNAYQGFAKQNYTMLDNLKLGYGGTKTEMQRLLEDAQKISGVEYDISSLSDVYSAIHVIQENLGITGTTSKEAATTLEGSFNQMSSAAKNLLGNLAIGGDIKKSVQELTGSVITYSKNLIPAIRNIVSALPGAAVQLIGELAPVVDNALMELGDTIIQKAPNIIPNALETITNGMLNLSNVLPEFLAMGIDIVVAIAEGIINSIPSLVANVPRIINNVANAIYMAVPQLIIAGASIVISLVKGIVQNAGLIVQNIPQIIMAILNCFSIAGFYNAGVGVVTKIGNGIKGMSKSIPNALKTIGNNAIGLFRGVSWRAAGTHAVNLIRNAIAGAKGLISSALRTAGRNAWNAFKGISWSSLGRNIVNGIVSGITAGASKLFGSLKDLADRAIAAAKKAIDSHSPSRRFDKEVGATITPGIANGVTRKASVLYDAITGVADKSVSTARNIFTKNKISPDFNVRNASVDAAVSGMKTAIESSAEPGGTAKIALYAFPNGPRMGEWVVNTYDRYKPVIG